MTGFHHIRARMRNNLKPFPSEKTLERYFDYLMYVAGFIGPVSLFPQIRDIYITKNTAGVSLMTWVLITFFNILWMIYGAIHKDKQLFFANTLVVIFDLILVIGILVYSAV